MNREIAKDLLRVLDKYVTVAQYLNAENIARKTEKEEGALTDLRSLRNDAIDAVDDLAEAIERLAVEVENVNAPKAVKSELYEALGHAFAPPTTSSDRFPADDEHQSAP